MKDQIFDKAKAMAMEQIPDLQAAQVRAGLRNRAKLNTGPRDASEVRIFQVERTRVEIQHSVNAALTLSGWTKAELAEKSGLTLQVVERFFEDDCNVTFRELIALLDSVGLSLSTTYFRS